MSEDGGEVVMIIHYIMQRQKITSYIELCKLLNQINLFVTYTDAHGTMHNQMLIILYPLHYNYHLFST